MPALRTKLNDTFNKYNKNNVAHLHMLQIDEIKGEKESTTKNVNKARWKKTTITMYKRRNSNNKLYAT